MYVMKNFDDVLVATNVGKMVIPDDPMELDCIKSTISLLFGLKVNLYNIHKIKYSKTGVFFICYIETLIVAHEKISTLTSGEKTTT